MASTKCPVCGLQNFAAAIICRHHNYTLLGDTTRIANLSPTPARKESFRWILSAALISLAFAVLLFFAVFLFKMISNAMHSSHPGWTDFTSTQKEALVRWHLTLLGLTVIIVFTIFYLRRHKHD